MVKICLNMIVKNESKIITRLFDSIINLIDFWIISDTGSTDGTQDIITNYFNDKKIEGQLHNHTWKNFGHNRDLSLKLAQNCDYPFDYILLLDADMKLVITDKFNKNDLTDDVYTLKQGSIHFSYYNVRLIKKSIKAFCVSVTHEYYSIPNGAKYNSLESLYIDDIGDGGSKANKFSRDISLLEQGLIDEPNNSRYFFYLAESYKNFGNKQMAIKNYLLRIKAGGWYEEIYMSCYNIGNLCENINDRIFYYLEAIQYNPKRLETICKLIEIYRFEGKHHIALSFYKMGKDIQNMERIDRDILFMEMDAYRYLLDYELSIIANHVFDNKKIGLNISNELMLQRKTNHININRYNCVRNNLWCYIEPIKLSKIKNFTYNLPNNKFIFYTNPCLYFHNNIMKLCLRAINFTFDIKNNSYFVNNLEPSINNPVISETHLYTLNNNFSFTDNNYSIVGPDINDNNFFKYPSHVKGIEDIRQLCIDNVVYSIGNCREVNNNNVPAMILGVDNKFMKLTIIDKPELNNLCQKNWSMFEHNNELHILYGFSPLIFLKVNTNTGECNTILEYDINLFLAEFRGGTNGFWINNKLHFIIHEVIFKDNRRFYAHRIVIFNDELKIINISVPFYFENFDIEYCMGAIYNEKTKEVFVSYGVQDKKACISKIDIDSIEYSIK